MNRKFKIEALHKWAARRPVGYVEDVLSRGVVEDGCVTLSEKAYKDLCRKYRPAAIPHSPSSGPGTELKKLLASIGIHASPTCKCNGMARRMDAWGPDESLNHMEEIVDVMEETAKKRGLPFLRTAGRSMVRIACWKARRKGNKQ